MAGTAAQSRQLSGLAEQVSNAVSGLSRLQHDAASERSTSYEGLSTYHEKWAAALSEQEARVCLAQPAPLP